jgi:PAS domain S-box-containing protein
MIFQSNPIALADFLSAAIGLALVMICIYRKNNPGALKLAALMGAITIWAVCGALEAAAADYNDKIFWSQISYVGIVAAPVFWMLFASRFANHDHFLPTWFRWGVWIIPAATVGIAFTNSWHHLLWGDIVPSQSPNVLIYTHNIWFWVHFVYSYLLMLMGTLLLFFGLRRTWGQQKAQSVLLLFGALIPWVGNLIYALGLSPIPGLDITPWALLASGAFIAADMLSFGLLDLVPLAREAVVENMLDGIIVIDSQDRVVDMNPAARALFPEAGTDLVGKPVQSFFLVWSSLAERLKRQPDSHAEVQLGGEVQRNMDVRASLFKTGRDKVMGRLVVLRDISARIQMEKALLAIKAQLENQEERYQTLVEKAPFPIIISSQESGEVLYMNPRTEAALGLPTGTGRGRKAVEFYARAEDRDRALAAIALDTTGVTERIVDLRRLDGRMLRCLVLVSTLDFDNQKAYFVTFLEVERIPSL